MPAAAYTATIQVTIMGSSAAPFTVSVTFTVSAGTPQLQVSPSSVSLSASIQSPGVQTQMISVRNSGGGGVLNFSAAIAGGSPWVSVSGGTQAAPNSPATLQLSVNSTGLAVGNFHDILRVTAGSTQIEISIALLVANTGAIMSVSTSGLTFQERQGNGFSQPQSVSVFDVGDPLSTLNWTATVVSGADWAILSNASGTSTPTSPGSFTVTAGGDANSLPVGAAYALIRITAADAQNAPQYVTAVLSIQAATTPPAPQPVPAGLFFNGNAPAQMVNIFTSSSSAVPFQASASTSNGINWLTVAPASGMTSTQIPGSISVAVNIQPLNNGVYFGSVNISEGGVLRTIGVTLVVTGQNSVVPIAHASGCSPSRLVLTQIALSSNFAVPAGWPATLIAQLNDDCGNPVSSGSVIAGFSNGDPPLTLAEEEHSSLYTATWQPGAVNSGMTVTLHASASQLTSATEVLPGAVTANAFAPPTLVPNGTLHIFFNTPTAQQLGYGLAPGNVAQVFGTNLASVTQAPGVVPLVNQFQGTFMLIGGIQAPLYFVSPNQLDVEVPAELQPNQQYSAVVSFNGALSTPEFLTIVPGQPGVAANADGSVIAQHAVDYSLVTPQTPARPGESLIIYLAGLGATNPMVPSGTATPSQLVPAVAQPTLTVNGEKAQIVYAGLTPGGIGLYQINFTVPSDAPSGSLPLIVMQNGVPGNATTLPVSNN